MSVFDIIGDLLLKLRFKYGVEEYGDSTELASAIREQAEGEEKTYIYAPEGRPRPYLVSAYREGGLVSLAFLDLDDVRVVPNRVDVEKLEEASTTVRGGSHVPFLFPLKVDGDVIYAAFGFKTVVEEAVLTGGYIDALLEEFEQDSDLLFKEVRERLFPGSRE